MELQTTVDARPASVAQAAEEPESAAAAMVSFHAEVPEVLLASMHDFMAQHPNWDQYRLFQAALAGFLVQNGLHSRGVTRCYLANLFPAQVGFRSP
ncbi:DUF2811 domain-containing protein [Cyanobium sp. Alchichica 3B3-8F6]|uniref:DUF2811 domain-containing protein n=2 Tax=Cyanophyceae TaxID=3028117 RepID=UPI0039655FFF